MMQLHLDDTILFCYFIYFLDNNVIYNYIEYINNYKKYNCIKNINQQI